MTDFNSGIPASGSSTWEQTMILMLRSLIGDLDETTYTDERLKQVLVIAAYGVNAAADFMNDYVVDVTAMTITPDPVEAGDQDFAVLTVYKAACILVGSEVKTQSLNAIAIKDGPSSIDLRGVSGSLSGLQKDLCGKYDDMLNKYRFEKGNGGAPLGEAILGPFSPGSWGVLFNGYGGHY